MKTITSYHCPDLDGVACMMAYSSLLKKRGQQSECVYTGDLGLETEFVRNYTHQFPLKKIETYAGITEIILVDTSDTNDIHSTLVPENVIEIIDHRKVHHADKFINAKVDIQQVGSCATLIWERMKAEKFVPEMEKAIYLYSAIISNTINLKNKVTTDRDIIAAGELLSITKVKEDYIEKMFKYKSNVNKNNLKQVLLQDVAIKDYRAKKISIFQLEVADMQELVEENLNLIIEIIKEVKQKYNIDFVMFNGIDILNGYNIVFAADQESSDFFGRVFDNVNLVSPYKTSNIVMRKEIWSMLEAI